MSSRNGAETVPTGNEQGKKQMGMVPKGDEGWGFNEAGFIGQVGGKNFRAPIRAILHELVYLGPIVTVLCFAAFSPWGERTCILGHCTMRKHTNLKELPPSAKKKQIKVGYICDLETECPGWRWEEIRLQCSEQSDELDGKNLHCVGEFPDRKKFPR